MGESKKNKKKDKKKMQEVDRSNWVTQPGVQFNTSRNNKDELLQQLRAIITSTRWILVSSSNELAERWYIESETPLTAVEASQAKTLADYKNAPYY